MGDAKKGVYVPSSDMQKDLDSNLDIWTKNMAYQLESFKSVGLILHTRSLKRPGY